VLRLFATFYVIVLAAASAASAAPADCDRGFYERCLLEGWGALDPQTIGGALVDARSADWAVERLTSALLAAGLAHDEATAVLRSLNSDGRQRVLAVAGEDEGLMVSLMGYVDAIVSARHRERAARAPLEYVEAFCAELDTRRRER
jgi:hypothetical protein